MGTKIETPKVQISFEDWYNTQDFVKEKGEDGQDKIEIAEDFKSPKAVVVSYVNEKPWRESDSKLWDF